jgi:hypothetical protein
MLDVKPILKLSDRKEEIPDRYRPLNFWRKIIIDFPFKAESYSSSKTIIQAEQTKPYFFEVNSKRWVEVTQKCPMDFKVKQVKTTEGSICWGKIIESWCIQYTVYEI